MQNARSTAGASLCTAPAPRRQTSAAPRHRHQEFIPFLNWINRETPAGREVHLIVDNYATQEHPKSVARAAHALSFTDLRLLAQRGRGLLRQLTQRRLKRGVFNGVADLQTAINWFLQEINASPKPFI